MTTKLVQSVSENSLSIQSKNHVRAFSAREASMRSQRIRELASTWAHHRADARSPNRNRIRVSVSSVT